MSKEELKPKISKSKYELTLAEFPLFLLSKGGIAKKEQIESIEYEDTITGRGGEIIPRKWKVFPHSKLGFGKASTFETLYDLFQIWKENDFNGQDICFGSIYNLLKYRGRKPDMRIYNVIKKDLNCLVGITIEAKNAFWDNELKAYVDMTFHLFDELKLYKEKSTGQATLPFARIKASDVLYGSILKNSLLITDFDSKFFHSLTPVEQRLALYLSKIFRSQVIHKRELFEFAQQIPIYSKQKKHIKQQLKRACSGLVEKQFKLLESYDFEKNQDGKEFIVFKKGGQLLIPFKKLKKEKQSQYPKESYEIDILIEDILEVCQDKKSKGFYKKVATLIPKNTIYRAISEVKEIRDLGEIKKSKGAVFTSLIKKYAQELGIDF